MPGFDVSPAELRSTRTFVDEVARDVVAEVRRLGRDVDDLLESGWTGRSSRAFARGWTEWKQGGRDTLAALDTMADLLGMAGSDYADSDVFVSERFRKFAS